jgi:hypothetical protein
MSMSVLKKFSRRCVLCTIYELRPMVVWQCSFCKEIFKSQVLFLKLCPLAFTDLLELHADLFLSCSQFLPGTRSTNKPQGH